MIIIFSFTLTKALSDNSLIKILAILRASSTPECGFPSNSRPIGDVKVDYHNTKTSQNNLISNISFNTQLRDCNLPSISNIVCNPGSLFVELLPVDPL